MMKESWLMVNKIGISANDGVCGTSFELIKRVPNIGKKAQKLADEYSKELNEGRTMEDCVKQGKDYINVVAIPWSQAREYINFNSWPCNKDFEM